jgi:hypothetical protein
MLDNRPIFVNPEEVEWDKVLSIPCAPPASCPPSDWPVRRAGLSLDTDDGIPRMDMRVKG